MTEPKLDDVDCFYPDSQLVLYYTKMVAGLEERLVRVKEYKLTDPWREKFIIGLEYRIKIAKQKLEAAQERQKELK